MDATVTATFSNHKKHTKETLLLISQSSKRPCSDEQRAKLSAISKGKDKLNNESRKIVMFKVWNRKNSVWKRASEIHDIWIKESKCGLSMLCRLVDLEIKDLGRMHDKFRGIDYHKEWIPSEDPIWLEWVESSSKENLIPRKKNNTSKPSFFSRWDKNERAWLKADKIYTYWLEKERCGLAQLCEVFGFSYGELSRMHDKFLGVRVNSPWIPSEDSIWLEWVASKEI
jgi:hypothetical protein